MKTQGYCPVNGQYQGLCGCSPGQCYERDEYPHTFNGQVERFNTALQPIIQALTEPLINVIRWTCVFINKGNKSNESK